MTGPSALFRVALLVERREQRARWVFVLGAIPLILFALIGANYGAFLPYAVLAAICLAQAVYPTLLAWALSLGVFAAGAIVYTFALAQDLFRVLRGQPASIFLNPYDTVAFVFLLTLLIALCVGIWFLKPRAPQRPPAPHSAA